MAASNAPALKPRVLVVDDDARLRAMLVELLRRNDFDAVPAANCAAANRALTADEFELVVLDLTLPDGNGLDFCRDMRERGDATAVLMLTAQGDDVDRVLGLEIGADDYLAKPCNPRELVARLRAILRRTGARSAVPGAPVAGTEQIRFGVCTLDPASRMLTRAGESAQLTTAEFAVLFALVTRAGQTLSRDQLARLARGRNAAAFDRSIDMQVSRLRKLIEPDPSKPRYLQTVWGAGYTFVPDVTAT
jgi:two-component system, OmpR family, phosphate regulon response regulator OmpR